MFLMLLMGHAVADFGLQSPAMAKGKNRNVPKDYIPPGQTLQICWPYYLAAHSLIHGAMVMIITGSVTWSMFEAVTHGAIDFGKCESWYGVHMDQAMHMMALGVIAYQMMKP